MKTVPAIDYQDAKRIVDARVEKALQLQKAAVIAVADAHGERIVFARMDANGGERSPSQPAAIHSLVAPRIESSLNKADVGYSITLQTPALARNVYVSFAEVDLQMSDNYFDLLRGEPFVIPLKTSSTLDQLLKCALTITSLMEAFQPAAP